MLDLPVGAATGIGSMPGDDVVDATRIVFGELPDLPHLPELPGRGAPASMTGRAMALLVGLGADLQPAGWRLTDAAGLDQRRAASLLAQDLDTLEEQAEGYAGPLKVQLAGPWTLAASVERPRGDKVLADHGARRELAQSLAEGVAGHLRDLRRRVSGARPVLQLDEPALTAVLAARVPTASGFGKHRAVDIPTAVEALRWWVEAAEAEDVPTVLHSCAARLPWEVVRRAGMRAASVDASLIEDDEFDDYAAAVEAGVGLWLGVVPTTAPAERLSADAVAERARDLVRRWGFDPDRTGDLVVLTPACGLAGASPTWAREALRVVRDAARQLSAIDGRIGP